MEKKYRIFHSESFSVKIENLLQLKGSGNILLNQVSFNFKKFRNLLILSAIILTILSVTGEYIYYTYNKANYFNTLFNLEGEANISSYFSTLLFLISSIMFYIAGKLQKGEKRYINWMLLSGLFFLLSVDDAASIHEHFTKIVRPLFLGSNVTWIIPRLLFAIVSIGIFLRFYLALEKKWKILFFLSGLIFMTGAVGIELSGSLYKAYYGKHNIGFALINTLEEVFEMTGIILLIHTLSLYINTLLYNINKRRLN